MDLTLFDHFDCPDTSENLAEPNVTSSKAAKRRNADQEPPVVSAKRERLDDSMTDIELKYSGKIVEKVGMNRLILMDCRWSYSEFR